MLVSTAQYAVGLLGLKGILLNPVQHAVQQQIVLSCKATFHLVGAKLTVVWDDCVRICQVQDGAFALVKLHEISVSPLVCFFEDPQNSIPCFLAY